MAAVAGTVLGITNVPAIPDANTATTTAPLIPATRPPTVLATAAF